MGHLSREPVHARNPHTPLNLIRTVINENHVLDGHINYRTHSLDGTQTFTPLIYPTESSPGVSAYPRLPRPFHMDS